VRNRSKIAEQLFRDCSLIAAQLLCSNFVIAEQSLRDRCDIAAKSVRNFFAIGYLIRPQSLRNRYEIVAHTLQYRTAVVSQSIQNRCVIVTRSLRKHCARERDATAIGLKQLQSQRPSHAQLKTSLSHNHALYSPALTPATYHFGNSYAINAKALCKRARRDSDSTTTTVATTSIARPSKQPRDTLHSPALTPPISIRNRGVNVTRSLQKRCA
jgi:hypothetical protein